MQKENERDFFENIEDDTKTFVHPEYLPNTSFIKKKPIPLKRKFYSEVDKFLTDYKIAKSRFCKDFLNTKKSYEYLMSEDYDTSLRVIDSALLKMHLYKKENIDKNQGSVYKRKNAKELRAVIIKKIELFSARHFITEGKFSEFFFKDKRAMSLFRSGDISFRCSTIDRVMSEMHQIDMDLIHEMGKEYERWAEKKADIRS